MSDQENATLATTILDASNRHDVARVPAGMSDTVKRVTVTFGRTTRRGPVGVRQMMDEWSAITSDRCVESCPPVGRPPRRHQQVPVSWHAHWSLAVAGGSDCPHGPDGYARAWEASMISVAGGSDCPHGPDVRRAMRRHVADHGGDDQQHAPYHRYYAATATTRRRSASRRPPTLPIFSLGHAGRVSGGARGSSTRIAA